MQTAIPADRCAYNAGPSPAEHITIIILTFNLSMRWMGSTEHAALSAIAIAAEISLHLIHAALFQDAIIRID